MPIGYVRTITLSYVDLLSNHSSTYASGGVNQRLLNSRTPSAFSKGAGPARQINYLAAQNTKVLTCITRIHYCTAILFRAPYSALPNDDFDQFQSNLINLLIFFSIFDVDIFER